MSTHCPHCKNSIVVKPGQDAAAIVCDSCGKPVSADGLESTIDNAAGAAPRDIFETVYVEAPTPSGKAARRLHEQQAEAAELARVEGLLARFEEAWRLGSQPEIEEYLGGDGPRRFDLVVELVHADVSYRLKANLEPRLEQYLDRFPALLADRSVVLELAVAEFRARERTSQPMPLDSFLARFPDYRDELAVLLQGQARSRRRRFPVRLSCPHCQSAVEIADPDQSQDVACPSCGESFSVDGDQTQTWVGKKLPRIGKFQLINVVGQGAFGTVYRAQDEELKRTVAIKVPRRGTFSTKDDEDRFIREARTAAQLDHSGIVRVIDARRTDEFPYIVTEFVRGVTLAQVLKTRRYDVRASLELLSDIAEALDYAHRQGIVHRDLKPDNVMIDINGRPRVMDFGLAKRDVTGITMSSDGHILGTPAYMPPEQAQGEAHRADRRSDVYSLGVILFELLTGERPFRGNSVTLMHQTIHDEAPSVRSLNQKLSRDVETIVAKCLEKSPDRRYQTAQELADDVWRHLRHEPINARPITPLERAWRWCKRNPTIVKAAASIFLILVVSLVTVSIFWRGEAAAEAEASRRAQENAELAEQKQQLYEQEREARQRAVRYFAETRVPTVPDNLLRFYPEVGEYHAQVLQREAEQFEKLLKEGRPDDVAFELELAQTYVRLADIRVQLGDSAAARSAYQDAETILTRQLTQDSDNADCRWALGVARTRLASLLSRQEEFEQADKLFRAAIDDLQTAGAIRPQDARPVHSLGETRLRYAALLERQAAGDGTEVVRQAVIDFETALGLAPRSPNCLRLLGDARTALTGMLSRKGEFDAALQVVNDGLRQLDALAVAPTLDNADFLVAREQARIYLASLLRARGEYERELAAYEQVIAAYRGLEQFVPDSQLLRENLALTRVDLGQALLQIGETQRAESEARVAQEAYRELFSSTSRPEHLEGLAAASATLGAILMDLARPEEAEVLLAGSIQALRKLEQQFSHILPYRHRRAVCHSQLARIYHSQSDFDRAEEQFDEAAWTLKELAEMSPYDPEYKQSAAFVRQYWGTMLYERNGPARAAEALKDAIQLWNQVTTEAPIAEYANARAVFLAECIDPELRDAARAIELATQATREAPANAIYLGTLGAAYYRNGDWESANTSLRQAIEQRGESDGRDLLYLAMTQGRLDEHEEARKTFEQGFARFQERRPGNAELRRLAQEAAGLLGIETTASK